MVNSSLVGRSHSTDRIEPDLFVARPGLVSFKGDTDLEESRVDTNLDPDRPSPRASCSYHPRRSFVGDSDKRRHVATLSRRHRRRGRRSPHGVTTARSEQCSLYRIRKRGGTERTSACSDRKKWEPNHRAHLSGQRSVLRDPLAWQAVADFRYRDFEGYAWHPQPGHQTAQVEPTASLLDYVVGHVAEVSPSVTLNRAQRREIAAAFARYHVGVAVVVGGYPGSERLTRVITRSLAPDIVSETGRSGIPVRGAGLDHRTPGHPFALFSFACARESKSVQPSELDSDCSNQFRWPIDSRVAGGAAQADLDLH